MADTNIALLCGRLAKDPELKAVNNSAVCNCRVLTSKKGANGQEYTQGHNVTVWGTMAEYIAKAQTGDLIKLWGEIRTRKYQKDGQDHYITEVVFDVARIWPSKKNQGGQGGYAPPAQQGGYGQQAPASAPPDDDLPF